jgi:hypothetical protein
MIDIVEDENDASEADFMETLTESVWALNFGSLSMETRSISTP